MKPKKDNPYEGVGEGCAVIAIAFLFYMVFFAIALGLSVKVFLSLSGLG